MERINQEYKIKRKTELIILIIFTIYTLGMMILADARGWRTWISVAMVVCVTSSWSVFITDYRTYRFRAIFTTCAMQFVVQIYMTHVDDVLSVLGIFMAFAIFIGYYGVLEALWVTIVSAALLFFYHIAILHSIEVTSWQDAVRIGLQIINIFLALYIIYFWAKKRNESDEQAKTTIEELKVVQQSKDDFLANVSHEIRTPINTICGMSEVVLAEDDPMKAKEDIINIQRAGRNLLSVVSDILDFSELQSGKAELEEEPYNVSSMINDIIHTALVRKKDKPVELIVNCDADVPSTLYGDEKKIRRAVLKVLDNAIKFTKEGFVSISFTCRRESYGVNFAITVKDTGIGMKEESLEKLFTTFNQVDAKRNREEGGLGLGLAISKALVQKMGGVITVKSKYEKGTTVKIVVPQKVLNDNPIANLNNRENLNIAVYVDMEQFLMSEIRDEYVGSLRQMIEQLRVRCLVCRNLPELKRREETEHFTHVFLSRIEYCADKKYFDELAERTNLIVIVDPWDEQAPTNPKIKKIYKPFYILPIVTVINGEENIGLPGERLGSNEFVAPNAHILVVDDNEMNLMVIESLLEHYQIQVTTAKSGKEALEKIQTMNYDFVFMDHMMPEMDGIETMHQIRSKVGGYYQRVPIVALTANAIAGAREMFMAEGFSDFLEKPIEVSTLERVLRRNLPQEKLIFTAHQKPKTENAAIKDEKTENVEVTDADVDADAKNDLAQGKELRLDTEKGLLYCGGEVGYQKVLMSYSKTGDENRAKVEELFEKEDWKDYTIAVHGIKSAMLSIGATHLSEMAKQLEAAGKKDDISYIKENHAEMIAEYRRTIDGLKTYFKTEEIPDKQEAVCDLPKLTDESFDVYVQQMEDAMYELDGEQMLAIVSELETYQYEGTALKEQLVAVRRKVEMSDYMSAGDTLMKLRERLHSHAKGGDT